jgi:hypothetical protein
MMIPACQPGMNAQDGAAALERPIFDTQDMPPAAAPAAPMVATPALAYADFEAAVKDALRDIHSPDLLSRNPLLLHGICNLGKSAGPQELKALLCETVGTLFGNARDEKLRRVLELTYFQPALKQGVVALWESSRVPQAQPELPSTPETSTKNGDVEGETAISHVVATNAAERFAPPALVQPTFGRRPTFRERLGSHRSQPVIAPCTADCRHGRRRVWDGRRVAPRRCLSGR